VLKQKHERKIKGMINAINIFIMGNMKKLIIPLLQNPEAEWKHPAFTQVQRGNTPGHSVRTEE